MITVNDLITKLQAYARENPTNGSREVYLRIDGETCYEFGCGVNVDGFMSDQHYFVILPQERGHWFKMRNANLQG